MPQVSTITRSAVDVARFETPARPAETAAVARLAWRRRIAKLTRWLHIYGSMGSLAIVLFFAITGITLNHQDWFADRLITVERHGTMNTAWLRTSGPDGVDKLQVVEYLRASGALRGTLSDFRVDDEQCEVAFKTAGYAASALIDRATGAYDITESRMGFAAVVNDLHKGRDTGGIWRAAIDLAAVLLVCISLSGLVLLYFVHKHRLAGAIMALAGALVSYLVYVAFVP